MLGYLFAMGVEAAVELSLGDKKQQAVFIIWCMVMAKTNMKRRN